MTQTMTNQSLCDAMYAMSLAKRAPDAELLDDFVRRYPEHADALTEFAIELAVDALEHTDDPDLPPDLDAISPVVSRVMSRFQNRLFEISQKRMPASTAPLRATVSTVNPFAKLDRSGFRALAARLDMNTALLSKLRDRHIEPETIPRGFCRRVAEEMDEDVDVLSAHLCALRDVSRAHQYYKAQGKPNVHAIQSFEEAVRGSGLSEEQQKLLLSYRD